MRRMLIIADDLSGAADCASACIHSGLSAAVALGDLVQDLPYEILSVDCDTRHLDPATAAARVAQLLRRYAPDSSVLLFKKLDSTLRGNVGAELSAMLDDRRSSHLRHRNIVDRNIVNQRIVAIMAPAFPAGGRTTRGGHQFVNGTALHETETWQHHTSTSSTHASLHIPTMLSMAGMQSALVTLPRIRSGGENLRHTMKTLAAAADVLVCDAETDEDLRAIATASLVLGPETIWAGSAGLASHLPHVAGLSSAASRGDLPIFTTGPMLLVIGSMSSVSRNQVKVLVEASSFETPSSKASSSGVLPVALVSLPPHVLLRGSQSPLWSEYARQLSTLLHTGHEVVVVLEAANPLHPGEGRRLSSALGAMMTPLAETIGALVASGGETARAILEAWGVTGLRMHGELEPGIPFTVTEGWSRPLPVLTKAGAFGDSEALLRCWRFLHTLDRTAMWPLDDKGSL